MSGNEDKSRKTEQPTPHKLRQARKKGQVSRSKDVVSTISLIAMLAYIWIFWDYNWSLLEELMITTLELSEKPLYVTFKYVTEQLITVFMMIAIPSVVISALAVILSSVMQFGFLFAPEQIKIDPQKINPIAGFQRIFSLRNMVEMLKAIVKITVFVVVFYLIIYHYAEDILNAAYCGLSCKRVLSHHITMLVCIAAIIIFILTAVFDSWFQKYQFTKDQMMTKEELKRDRKDTQGDPLLKSRRVNVQREMISVDLLQRCGDIAVLLVANNMAIGLKYEPGETPLPIITIKEQKLAATRVAEIAAKRDKPIVEDTSLTRALWKSGKLDQYIPTDYIGEVAQIFAGILKPEAS
ncbi:EscU/YscU/HrcU family type III secretion system export apparatus switch protein [Exilibacterium tricleocarpae]|uniref:EscU/YscU/HrcU family type III secretion system export apparatus switch protein n=1 Tax=Exilibacterium tricleocarpae TaxID=2591008 RepID=A0A545SY98_9GAMM|nr:EscU/YscU/HrcU family type III secretion system export apparatus switch protein [Exilibacterium tricleocarpae]TQV69931.1 EscU/YscU/HrcU family type III secretion system export apparatus switch protein [Exilibacterium tricleocarpae]